MTFKALYKERHYIDEFVAIVITFLRTHRIRDFTEYQIGTMIVLLYFTSIEDIKRSHKKIFTYSENFEIFL